jgi:hypothetical protein
MASPKLSAFEPVNARNIHELLEASGPCITVYLPPYHPGEISPRAQHASLKDDLHAAARKLSSMHVTDSEAQDLLEPLRQFAAAPDSDAGFHWPRVIFRSPDLLRAFFFRMDPVSNVTVGRHFQILPAIGDLQIPSQFYILKLSKRRMSIMRVGLHMESVNLPGKTPDTLEEFLELDRPDHDQENRASIGGPAAGRRIRFGTGDERENQQSYVADFFKMIDRSVRELLRDPKIPLVLTGLEEDVALFRSITSVANVLPGSVPGALSDAELLLQSSTLIREVSSKRASGLLAESKEQFAPARFLTDLDSILKAASAGRVARLFVGMPIAMDERVNDAAVETAHNSGEVLPVPDAITIAATLRY